MEKPVKLRLKLDFVGHWQDYWPLAYPKSDFCIRILGLTGTHVKSPRAMCGDNLQDSLPPFDVVLWGFCRQAACG